MYTHHLSRIPQRKRPILHPPEDKPIRQSPLALPEGPPGNASELAIVHALALDLEILGWVGQIDGQDFEVVERSVVG